MLNIQSLIVCLYLFLFDRARVELFLPAIICGLSSLMVTVVPRHQPQRALITLEPPAVLMLSSDMLERSSVLSGMRQRGMMNYVLVS